MLLAVVGGVLAGWLLGGSLQRLSAMHLAGWRWLLGALAVQLVGGVALRGVAYAVSLALSLALAAIFLARNPALAGRGLLIVGLALNAAAIVANGAMPVSLRAEARAGIPTGRLLDDPRHTIDGPDTVLRALTDQVPLPLPLEPQVLSIGDVLVAAGAGLLLCQGMRTRPPHPQGSTRIPSDGAATNAAGWAKPAAPQASSTAAVTRATDERGSSTTALPPNPPPVIRAPVAPALSAVDTTRSNPGEETS